MNHAKIAAALHALADAFLADVVEAVETILPLGKAGKGKAKAAAEPAASAPAAPSTVVAEPAAAAEPPAPVVTITKDQLNKAVLKVAAKSRDAAEAILSKFGQKNTVTLPPELWQAVYDAFEEEIAKQDAAAVQVAQSSLV
jgi:predicted lipid-binding transport protein (Tim44 family)